MSACFEAADPDSVGSPDAAAWPGSLDTLVSAGALVGAPCQTSHSSPTLLQYNIQAVTLAQERTRQGCCSLGMTGLRGWMDKPLRKPALPVELLAGDPSTPRASSLLDSELPEAAMRMEARILAWLVARLLGREAPLEEYSEPSSDSESSSELLSDPSSELSSPSELSLSLSVSVSLPSEEVYSEEVYSVSQPVSDLLSVTWLRAVEASCSVHD